uniref:Arrestin_C domain-containing protein n=1 Tax=Caenorhabditis tropicalis TaxID=1561998 RepID=A0A1I7TA14_9PELO
MTVQSVNPTCIHFKDISATYRPGDQVTGIIGINIHYDVPVQSLKLTWKGISSLKEKNPDGPQSISHYWDDIYLYLSEDVEKMERGEYQFPFSFQLPEGIPPSFKGEYGMVNHSVSVDLMGLTGPILREEKEFTVTGSNEGLYTLRGMYDFYNPLKNKIASIGNVDLHASINSHLVLPGSHPTIYLVIVNSSEKTLEKIKVCLIQKAHFHGKPASTPNQNGPNNSLDNKKITKTVIQEIPDLPISVHTRKKDHYTLHINIPEIITPSFKSPLMSVEYAFQIKVKTGGRLMPFSSKFICPVVVGGVEELNHPSGNAPPPYSDNAPPPYSGNAPPPYSP